MAKTKWRSREYKPSAKQGGIHSFYAEAVVTTDLTNIDLAHRVEARTGFKSYEVQAVIAAVADAVVALRAARSLWLIRQTLRLRHQPYRMARYADRLSRLSRRRRLWLGFVLAGSYNSVSGKDHRWQEFLSLRLPSYSIAACLFLLIALNADKAFAATRDYVNVTTTTDQTATAICDTVGNIIQQL